MKIQPVLILLLLTSCAYKTPPPIEYYTYQFIDDGSEKAKECEFECKKQEAQCKKLVAVEYQISFLRGSSCCWKIAEGVNKRKNEQCEEGNRACFKDVCGGEVKSEKHLMQ